MYAETELTYIKLESSDNTNDELRKLELIKKEEYNIINDVILNKIDKLVLKNENESKTKKIKKRTYELLEVSSAHGIPNIVRSKSLVILIMWIAFTIIASCLGSYYVINSILDYLKYYTVTKIDIIDESEPFFPTLTFCAYPSFETQINETILRVRFDGIYFSDEFSLIIDEFDDNFWGRCFRYNSGKNDLNQSVKILRSKKSGQKNGFKINMFLKTPVEYDFSEILLFIHNQTSPPYDMYNGGYWAKTGSWNYFEMNRIYYNRLDAPYSNCFKNVNLFTSNKTIVNKITEFNITYSHKHCQYLCSRLFVLEESKCGCNSSLNDFSKKCETAFGDINFSSMRDCISNYLKDFQYEKCTKYCPLECDSMSYEVIPYSEQMPVTGLISNTTRYDYGLNRFETYEETNRHFLAIYVYYKDLKYTLISEEPKTELFNFISNIGGILGFFLGVSFLSFIELFEIIIEIFCILFSNKIQVNII